MRIDPVTESDLSDLLPLMRGYCDFYEVAPSDEALLSLAQTLIDDPDDLLLDSSGPLLGGY